MSRRKVISTPDPAVAWAEKLWGELRTGLFSVEKTIAQIIHDKAWEPLGYNSFTEAWSAKLADISIASELRAHVVYEMYREGATEEDVARAVKGVGLDSAEAFKREMENGVPTSLATGRGKPKTKPDEFITVFVKVPREQHRKWSRIAKRNGTTLPRIMFAATEVEMGEQK